MTEDGYAQHHKESSKKPPKTAEFVFAAYICVLQGLKLEPRLLGIAKGILLNPDQIPHQIHVPVQALRINWEQHCQLLHQNRSSSDEILKMKQ